MIVMHATLVESERYAKPLQMLAPSLQPTVSPDGRWVSRQGAWDAEYLCNEHPWLGYIPDVDLSAHLQSPSHPSHQMGGPWRAVHR